MDDTARLLELVCALQDSVVDDSEWLHALAQVAAFTGGTGAFHIIANPATGEVLHSQCTGVDPVVNQRYLQYYAAKEIRMPPALGYPVGRVYTEQELLEQRVLRRSEIYGELLSPFDVPFVMASWLRKERTSYEAVVMEGSHKHGAFSDEARKRFSLVVPHLVRAVRLRKMFHLARQGKHAYRMALDTLPFGVILLDEQGSVLETTQFADLILHKGEGLDCSGGRLRATFRDDDRRLQQVIYDAVTPTRTVGPVAGGTLVVARNGTLRPLSVTVIPISPHPFFAAAQPAALVLVVDPERASVPRSSAIASTLGLTRAEADLAAELFGGSTLREAAEALGRSINTCKSQLKSIYQKTNCRNHADLAKKLLMATLVSQRTG